MDSNQIAQDVIQKLERQIDTVWNTSDDIQEREITIQLIPWIIKGTRDDLYTIMGNSESSDTFNKNKREEERYIIENSKYLLLQKKSSGDIVFPSGSIEKYETHKNKPNPQGIILGSLREFKEELHELLTIDAQNIIDVYPCIPFETDKKKYIQFRLLAYLLPEQVVDIEQKFADSLRMIPEFEQEHDHCYVRSYKEIIDSILDNTRNLKYSTFNSLESHSICNRRKEYYKKDDQ